MMQVKGEVDELVKVLDASRSLLFRLIIRSADSNISEPLRKEAIAQIRQIDAVVKQSGYPWPGAVPIQFAAVGDLKDPK